MYNDPPVRNADYQRLEESERRYRTIFENTGTATILIDPDFTIAAINSRFVSLLGYDRTEIEGLRKWVDFIHPGDVERMKRFHILRRQDPQAAPKEYEFRLITKSGQIRDIMLTIDMVPGTGQSVASLKDMTDRLRAERALKESEEKYRLLVETMTDGLIVVDERGIITYLNQRACQIIGQPRSRILGSTGTGFMEPESARQWDAQRAIRRNGGKEPYQIVWRGEKGHRTHTLISPQAHFDSRNRYCGSFAVITDITDLKNTEQALRLSEEMFSKAFRSSPTGNFIFTLSDTRIINVNDSFVRATGFGRFEAVSRTLPELGLFPDPETVRRICARLARDSQIRNMEVAFFTRDREIRQGILSAETVELWSEPSVLAAIEDVTDTRRLEREIINISERERMRIGRDLHDDLCPHLIGIEAASRVLVTKLHTEDKDSAAYAAKIPPLIAEAITKSRTLSRSLCPLHLADQGLGTSLAALAQNTHTLFHIPCRFSNQGTKESVDPTLAAHVHFIAQEAVHNAVKHAGPGKIRIDLAAGAKGSVLTVSDDGCGMDPAEKSSGMGLHIMAYRARAIGAELDIRSDPAKGTRIRLAFNHHLMTEKNP